MINRDGAARESDPQKIDLFQGGVCLFDPNWQTHSAYKVFFKNCKACFDSSERVRLQGEYGKLRQKLWMLDLDSIVAVIQGNYSKFGRPARNQAQLFRSFIAFSSLGETSLTNWCKRLSQDRTLAALIGCTPETLPPLGSYYDIIDRFWLEPESIEGLGRNDLSHRKIKPSKKSAPGKGNKLPPKHPGIVNKVCQWVDKDRRIPWNYEKTLQEIFSVLAVQQSVKCGLIPEEGIIASGDGSCLHVHASSYGHKRCDCPNDRSNPCNCPRHFSDPGASWGWDSDLGVWYYGYTFYAFVYHNPEKQVDLPIHIRFVDARRHDSVTAIVCLDEYRQISGNPRIGRLCLDSANDNYATYEHLEKHGILPFIDLNLHRGKNKEIHDNIVVRPDGTPLCEAGLPMHCVGYDKSKKAIKWRCPVVCGDCDSCPCDKANCSQSAYGRTLYTKASWDKRLYNQVPRNTEEWKLTYNNRTSCERINDRFLNDYKLHQMFIHSRKRFSFISMIIGINLHLDARIKAGISDAI